MTRHMFVILIQPIALPITRIQNSGCPLMTFQLRELLVALHCFRHGKYFTFSLFVTRLVSLDLSKYVNFIEGKKVINLIIFS